MPAEFVVVVENSGVDSDPPLMIVPRGGSNIVGLRGPRNLRLVANNPGLQIQELDRKKIASDPEFNLRVAQKTGHMPGGMLGPFRTLYAALALPAETRLFKISGNARLGRNGVAIRAMKPGSLSPEASLYVTVLDQRRVRLAIRRVLVRDANGAVRYHSMLPFNAEQFCAEMNAVWTPQANIVFELVPSNAAVPTEEAIKKVTHGAKTLRKILDPNDVAPLFKSLVTPDVDFTIFRVESIQPDGDIENLGRTFAKDNFAMVGDRGLTPSRDIDIETLEPSINVLRVMPHEAGHWLGDPDEKWLPHRNVTDPSLLMCGGGGFGLKVPVVQTLLYFNKNY